MEKGIILAGGRGTRLKPLTNIVCKQLLPVYDKPMIYYPLSTLMLLGIKNILIISTPNDIKLIERCLGDGQALGINLSYKIQEAPKGLADALLVAESFVQKSCFSLMLGDNIIYCNNLRGILANGIGLKQGAHIVGAYTNNPRDFGVIEFDDNYNILSLEEKPAHPKSHWAAIGLYFYDHHAIEYAKKLHPSKRKELEITDLNLLYLKEKQLKISLLPRGATWLDAGTFQTLIAASNFVQILEARQSLKVACIEEVAFHMGYIDRDQLIHLSKQYPKSEYGAYIYRIATERVN